MDFRFYTGLRLVAICTVCTKPFLNEVVRANELLAEIGSIQNELSSTSAGQQQTVSPGG